MNPRSIARDEAGLTLIEVMVAAMLFALVTTVIASIFITSLNAQQTVSGVSASANTAQSTASHIDNGVRNSWGFVVTPVGADRLVVARVAGSGSTVTYSCVAWYYSAAQGTIRTTRGPEGTVIGAPNSTQLAAWTLLTSSVSPRSGMPVFSDEGHTGSSLDVAFDVAGAGKKVTIQFTSTRPPAAPQTTLSGAQRCY